VDDSGGGVVTNQRFTRLHYDREMTELLEEALRRLACLSPEEQDAIASQIMQTLDDEEGWACRFRDGAAAAKTAEAPGEEHEGAASLEDELIE